MIVFMWVSDAASRRSASGDQPPLKAGLCCETAPVNAFASTPDYSHRPLFCTRPHV
jgi:hypothetical protein